MARFDAEMLKRELDQASAVLKGRIALLIEQASQRIVADHKQRMPRGTRPHPAGMDQRHLADRVGVLRISDLRHVVWSDAPHLHLVELGTRERTVRAASRVPVGQGWAITARRGRMPKLGPIFVPLGISRRADMLRMAEAVIGLDKAL